MTTADEVFLSGQECSAICTLVPCGCPTNGVCTKAVAADALYTLRTAVALETCSLCVCDVDGSLKVSASDALRLLNKAVGIDVELVCQAC